MNQTKNIESLEFMKESDYESLPGRYLSEWLEFCESMKVTSKILR